MKTQENVTKAFASAESMMEKFWDMWLVGLGSISWSQEQFENMVRKYLEQSQTAREENSKIIDELMNQVKSNQTQMQKMIQEAVNTALENAEPAYNYFEQLNQKVEELSKKVSNL
jgi:polyhydroxyalkanoate synthesis regulator phasin